MWFNCLNTGVHYQFKCLGGSKAYRVAGSSVDIRGHLHPTKVVDRGLSRTPLGTSRDPEYLGIILAWHGLLSQSLYSLAMRGTRGANSEKRYNMDGWSLRERGHFLHSLWVCTLISHCLVECFNPWAIKIIAPKALATFSKEHGMSALLWFW